jgi:hypothetical protein
VIIGDEHLVDLELAFGFGRGDGARRDDAATIPFGHPEPAAPAGKGACRHLQFQLLLIDHQHAAGILPVTAINHGDEGIGIVVAGGAEGDLSHAPCLRSLAGLGKH